MPHNITSPSEDTKHAGNTMLQRITQCVEPETYRSKVTDDHVMRSLLLQMNAKCGGVSVTVDWPAMMPVGDLVLTVCHLSLNFLLSLHYIFFLSSLLPS